VTRTRILIAEDEVHLREILRFQLEGAGYEVLEAHDGRQALELALAERPDLVLLDVMMPHIDGYEVCRRLRASFETRTVPVVMLTAKSEAADKVTGLQGGANDYVTKPWEQRELLLRVRNMLEWSRQQRAMSPLTGLPGNLTIQDEITRRIGSEEPFALLQLDIDFFKAFNDRYGYARGDAGIQRLAAILMEVSGRNGGYENFVGHIGGDDFVILTTPDRAEPIGREIIGRFDEAVRELYDPADLANGYVEVPNRRHVPERFPLMSLTVALVRTDQLPVTHVGQLIDIAQELKARGKGISGSVLVSERRRGDSAETDRSAA
jgi:PleD family two-component response regulator